MVRRSFHQKPVYFEHRKANPDFSDPVRHSDRIVMAGLFSSPQLGEASQVAPLDKLSVVIAIASAAIFLHERLTWHHWVGGLLIFAGATVLAYA